MSPSFCFLGTGRMNARHIKYLRRVVRRPKIAVASRDSERADAFRRRLGLDAAFGSYEQALDSAYDCVVIGTPPGRHAALVRMSIDAGKHVLVEKPAFQSLAEFAELWPLLRRRSTTVMVAENVHYDPFHRMIKAHATTDELGRPIYHELDRVGRHEPRGWRADPAEMPLGALHEGGVHWIRRIVDIASAYEGDTAGGVSGIIAFRGPLTTATPGEDTSVVVFRHRSGWMSRLVHSWAIRRNRYHTAKLLTENGAIYYSPRNLWARCRGPRKRWLLPKVRDAEGFVAMWTDFVTCVDSGRTPEFSLAHAWADFACLDAAYRSMASGGEEVPTAMPG